MRPADRAEIRCPKCERRPGPQDRWDCVPSCGTTWNTFWTRGVCPGCGVKWPITQCCECTKYSPHESWYHYREPGDLPAKAVEVEEVEARSVSAHLQVT